MLGTTGFVLNTEVSLVWGSNIVQKELEYNRYGEPDTITIRGVCKGSRCTSFNRSRGSEVGKPSVDVHEVLQLYSQ